MSRRSDFNTMISRGAAHFQAGTCSLLALDIVATYLAYYVAFSGQVGFNLFESTSRAFFELGVLGLVNVICFASCHVYRVLWEHCGARDAFTVVGASMLAALINSVFATFVYHYPFVPAVYINEWALYLLIVLSARVLARVAYSNIQAARCDVAADDLPRTLIVGAGEAGSLLVTRMRNRSRDLAGVPVAFIDDDRNKIGAYLHGVRIVGTCDDIPGVVAREHVDQIVVAIPSAGRASRQRIFETCMQTGVKTFTIPDVRNLPVDEKMQGLILQDVEVSDLLAREEIQMDAALVGSYVKGKVILVTGGGGSIGGELVRQLLPVRPSQVVLFDVYENTTYELYHEIKEVAESFGVDLKIEIGSITNIPVIEKVFDRYRPSVVFHAAAHKHVPLMEASPREAIENNVFGTLNVCELADKYKCSRFVQISTDKAVNPTNVMGATKRMDEMIVQYYASVSKTVYAAVRFGNVLGSHGSVIPLFRKQMKSGGPITVTHRDITRYFMTIPEAARLVITAGAFAEGGEIFILNMGQPVKIYDLAENLIRLSGLRLGVDIDIEITGLRPGEKLYEELLMDSEATIPTDNKDIMISTADALELDEVKGKLSKLEACLSLSNDEIKRVLSEVVPTYHPEY